ncbi:MAG: hypothetical protein AAGN82_29485 [Myxococcota bacterium]
MTTRKFTVSLDGELYAWAKRRAEEEGSSVSARVSDALRAARRAEALDEYVAWSDAHVEVSPDETQAAADDLEEALPPSPSAA